MGHVSMPTPLKNKCRGELGAARRRSPAILSWRSCWGMNFSRALCIVTLQSKHYTKGTDFLLGCWSMNFSRVLYIVCQFVFTFVSICFHLCVNLCQGEPVDTNNSQKSCVWCLYIVNVLGHWFFFYSSGPASRQKIENFKSPTPPYTHCGRICSLDRIYSVEKEKIKNFKSPTPPYTHCGKRDQNV